MMQNGTTRLLNPSVLTTDPLLRFVTLYSTLTKRGDFSNWALIFAKDRVECLPASGEFSDKFLYYNARVSEKHIEEVISREFDLSKSPELKEVFVKNATVIVKAIEQIRKFLDGTGMNVNYIYGATLREGVHYAKVVISRGLDMGAIRYQLRSLVSTTTFVPLLCPLRIVDIVAHYKNMYERVGRPYFARASARSRTLLQKVRKLSPTDVDAIVDYVVDEIGNSRLIAVQTHLFLISRQNPEAAVHVDAKRCIAVPQPSTIRDIIIIQSQDTGIVCLIYDASPDKIYSDTRVITRDLVRKYIRGILTDRESGIISSKINKTVYGLNVAEETELTDIRKLFGEAEESTETIHESEEEVGESGQGGEEEKEAEAGGESGQGSEVQVPSEAGGDSIGGIRI